MSLRGDLSGVIAERQVDRLSDRVARLMAELRHVRAENSRLKRQVAIDPLTGLGNRVAFRSRLGEAIAADRLAGKCTSLLMIDVDHFKAFNDRFGHPAGDRALRRFARLLRVALRASDFPARFGGEEFAAVLPATGLAGAVEVGERVRRAVAAGPWQGEGVTVSIGAATVGTNTERAGHIVRDADKALYRAKAAGRDRVCS